MKRLLTWLCCLTTVWCLWNAAWGKTDSPWVRGDVYAVSPDGDLELVLLPAWILPRTDVLTISTIGLLGNAEIKYVAERHRIVKEKIPLPDDKDIRQALGAKESDIGDRLWQLTVKYSLSRTTRTPQVMNENGGTLYSLIEEKEAKMRKIPLQGIAQQGMVPEVCTLLPRGGKIAVLFHHVNRLSPHYYLGLFEASSGQLCSELVPVSDDDVLLSISLLWLNDSTLAATAVGHNGGFWHILCLTTGKILASGEESSQFSNFIVLPDGLFVTEDEKTLKCVYRIRTGEH